MGTIRDVGAGLTLGSYELLVPVALGGTASVWAARAGGRAGASDDLRAPRLVAVKLMRAELSGDARFEAAFLDAARAARLRHPNVAEIVDLGEEDGTLYQVMEWVDGEPLEALLRAAPARGGVPLPVALRIARDACAGLHAAHEQRAEPGAPAGLIHGDVTPRNVLVGYDGTVKIVGFGIARAAALLLEEDAPGAAPGPARADPADRRADVLALGALLRALGVPAALEAELLGALADRPADRPATAADLERLLERASPAPATTEEVAAWAERLLGPRGERRRAAIHEALEMAGGPDDDAGPWDEPRPRGAGDAWTPASVRDARPAALESAELEAVAMAAIAAAEGASLERPYAGAPRRIRRPGRTRWSVWVGLALLIAAIAALVLAIRG